MIKLCDLWNHYRSRSSDCFPPKKCLRLIIANSSEIKLCLIFLEGTLINGGSTWTPASRASSHSCLPSSSPYEKAWYRQKSKPLTDAGSVICANVSWQVSWHCVALTRPCGHAGHSHLHWRREHHLLHDDRFNVQQRHRAPLKDFSIHPWLPWRQSLLLSSNWWIGFATPMGVWSERGGKSLDELCKGAAP